MRWITVEISATQGSAPRDAGTVMRVSETCAEGTIGGGALEHQAMATARRMLREGRRHHQEKLPLGPNLGQCCGGAVTLEYSDRPLCVDAAHPIPIDPGLLPDTLLGPLWIWGAGHVGRAVVRSLSVVQAFDITWIDCAASRFPKEIPPLLRILPTVDMPRLAGFAPVSAHHLIFTYSHDIDLALCAALLKRGFASCGLIGSATKWMRFQKRLRAHGLDPNAITCPIGDPRAGKHPDQIAHSSATALLRFAQTVQDKSETERAAC
ncbi:xanthine dehydrogenase accessory protein XdhC [Sulfitobacter sp. F26204]|uniref:xanthine dehydrogenase accessory protein XdhC n=1 Tax=Sulfitobacter sp. F26204 TaxID=2996014 RepID=UPI00225E52F7|nr:xanthine dehydrogenase accessory protein XdhC [Sulfitobacter sp. F26204]MCX7560970.1 xanthine dehydrogenase accessory protein XdhC [Sulfitobacter sp. F26204]